MKTTSQDPSAVDATQILGTDSSGGELDDRKGINTIVLSKRKGPYGFAYPTELLSAFMTLELEVYLRDLQDQIDVLELLRESPTQQSKHRLLDVGKTDEKIESLKVLQANAEMVLLRNLTKLQTAMTVPEILEPINPEYPLSSVIQEANKMAASYRRCNPKTTAMDTEGSIQMTNNLQREENTEELESKKSMNGYLGSVAATNGHVSDNSLVSTAVLLQLQDPAVIDFTLPAITLNQSTTDALNSAPDHLKMQVPYIGQGTSESYEEETWVSDEDDSYSGEFPNNSPDHYVNTDKEFALTGNNGQTKPDSTTALDPESNKDVKKPSVGVNVSDSKQEVDKTIQNSTVPASFKPPCSNHLGQSGSEVPRGSAVSVTGSKKEAKKQKSAKQQPTQKKQITEGLKSEKVNLESAGPNDGSELLVRSMEDAKSSTETLPAKISRTQAQQINGRKTTVNDKQPVEQKETSPCPTVVNESVVKPKKASKATSSAAVSKTQPMNKATTEILPAKTEQKSKAPKTSKVSSSSAPQKSPPVPVNIKNKNEQHALPSFDSGIGSGEFNGSSYDIVTDEEMARFLAAANSSPSSDENKQEDEWETVETKRSKRERTKSESEDQVSSRGKSVDRCSLDSKTIKEMGLCATFVVNGSCPYKDTCKFKHYIPSSATGSRNSTNNISQQLMPSNPMMNERFSGENAIKRKITMCKSYQAGRCEWGDMCNYAHNQAELEEALRKYNEYKARNRPAQKDSKQPLPANNPLENECFTGENAIRRKLDLCKNYQKGLCGWGEMCNYAHSEEERQEAHKKFREATLHKTIGQLTILPVYSHGVAGSRIDLKAASVNRQPDSVTSLPPAPSNAAVKPLLTNVEVKVARSKLKYKTMMCKGFEQGLCTFSAEDCKYAHSKDEIDPRLNHDEPCSNQYCLGRLRYEKFKTSMCPDKKKCKWGIIDCSFAHSEQELRLMPKREKCTRFYRTGRCIPSNECPYAHGDEELRVSPPQPQHPSGQLVQAQLPKCLQGSKHKEPCSKQHCPDRLHYEKYKTSMCIDASDGKCGVSANDCYFAHTREERRPLPKKEKCSKYFGCGKCYPANECPYAHSEIELKLGGAMFWKNENTPICSSSRDSQAWVPPVGAVNNSDSAPDPGSIMRAQADTEVCYICIGELKGYRKKLTCGCDRWHFECISKWVDEHKQVCPICKKSVEPIKPIPLPPGSTSYDFPLLEYR